MAEYGFQVVNRNSNIQADSTYTNMVFVQKKTAHAGTSMVSSNRITFYNRDYPMVVVGDTGGGRIAYYASSRSSDDFSYYHVGENNTVSYYAFDVAVDRQNNYGLQIFKSDGGIAFDSNNPYFKILDTFNVDTYYTGGTITKNYSGKKVGVLLARTMAAAIPSGPGGPMVRTLITGPGIYVSGSTLKISSFFLGSQPGMPSGDYRGRSTIIVVDLTNID